MSFFTKEVRQEMLTMSMKDFNHLLTLRQLKRKSMFYFSSSFYNFAVACHDSKQKFQLFLYRISNITLPNIYVVPAFEKI